MSPMQHERACEAQNKLLKAQSILRGHGFYLDVDGNVKSNGCGCRWMEWGWSAQYCQVHPK